ncbi:MAG TPA: YbaB/EbfC family nucleoid-associated protein [Natronosporangium sp.]
MATPPVNPFAGKQDPIDSLRAELDRIEVEIVSADGTVTVSMTRRAGVTVGLPPEAAAKHRTEASLARQASRAVTEAMRAYADRIVELADAQLSRGWRQPDRPRDERAERLAAETDRIRAVGKSPAGHVLAVRTGDTTPNLDLDIRDGALSELPPEQLATEISAAVQEANRNFRSQRASSHRRVYDSGSDHE